MCHVIWALTLFLWKWPIKPNHYPFLIYNMMASHNHLQLFNTIITKNQSKSDFEPKLTQIAFVFELIEQFWKLIQVQSLSTNSNNSKTQIFGPRKRGKGNFSRKGNFSEHRLNQISNQIVGNGCIVTFFCIIICMTITQSFELVRK